MQSTIVALVALVASASAFVLPAAPARSLTVVFGNGKYDGKVWDDAAKADVKSEYDSSKPWSDTNFDPTVRDIKGNACDASGYYPGETRYKDPIRPATSFAEYLKAKAEKEAAGN